MKIKKYQKGGWFSKLGDLMLQASTTSPTSVTGGDAYGARAMQAFSEGDVEKAKEIQREEDAIGSAAALASVQLPMLGVSLVTAPVQTTASLVFADQIGKQGKVLGEKAAENMRHYTRDWIESKKQFILGQLKGWCDETVFVEFEKQIL